MVNERRYRDKLKVVKVIESCQTMGQLSLANNMMGLYNKYYNTVSDLLQYTLCNRMAKIGQSNET